MPDEPRTVPQRRIVRLDLEPGDDQLHGRVDSGDANWRPFWGWLELIQAIDDAVATPDAAAPGRKAPDG